MKKAINVLICLLLAFILFYPIGYFVFLFSGYSFEISSFTAYSIILILLSVSLTVVGIIYSERLNTVMIVFLSVMLLMSVINAAMCIYHCHNNVLFIISVLLSIGCSLFMAIKHIKNTVLKIVMLSLFGVGLLFFAKVTFFLWIFSNIGAENIIETYESPSGKYYANLIDDDQGALGGATDVYIYEKDRKIDLFVFRAEKKPQSIYVGRWGEYKNAKIEWKDDNCIIINSKEYNVD